MVLPAIAGRRSGGWTFTLSPHREWVEPELRHGAELFSRLAKVMRQLVRPHASARSGVGPAEVALDTTNLYATHAAVPMVNAPRQPKKDESPDSFTRLEAQRDHA
jgi:hypothetical protein